MANSDTTTAALDALQKLSEAANLADSAIAAARKRGENVSASASPEMQTLRTISDSCWLVLDHVKKAPGGKAVNKRGIYALWELRNAVRFTNRKP
jgi:hypothetical protein